MAATINNFISAILTPNESFSTLCDVIACSNESGEVVVSRTTHFAEIEVEWHSKSYVVSLPLSDEGLSMARYAAVKLRSLRSEILLDYRTLQSEMSYVDNRGQLRQCDLLVEQRVHTAESLASVANSIPCEVLIGALRELEGEFERLNLRHGNLKASNIIVGQDGRLYPIRLHYAEVGQSCAEEFDALYSELSQVVGYDLLGAGREVAALQREPLNALYGYHSVGNPFGGMCVAESSAGYGYITPDGEELIAPQYIWAANMREGRAEVETTTGMGLIDSDGNYIIEPRYEIVEFDTTTGESRAKIDGQWFRFDYHGCLLE